MKIIPAHHLTMTCLWCPLVGSCVLFLSLPLATRQNNLAQNVLLSIRLQIRSLESTGGINILKIAYTAMPGTKKKAKKKKRINKKTAKPAGTKVVLSDAITPLYVPPPPVLGQKLLEVLQGWKEEKTQVSRVHASDRAAQKLSRQEIQDLKIVFNLMDNKKTGYINETEVLKVLRILGFTADNQRMKRTLKILGHLDAGNVQNTSKVFFLELVVEFDGDGRDICEEIEQGFKHLDCDNDGKITFDNLKKTCQSAGIHFSHQKLREMIVEADTNGDAAVDREEFTNIMLKTNLF